MGPGWRRNVRIQIVLVLLLLAVLPETVFCQTVARYNLLNNNSGTLSLVERNVSKEATRGRYFEKYVFTEGRLDSILLFDNRGRLYDDPRQSAVVVYEYSHGRLKFMKLFNRQKQRVNDAYLGLWSTEYFYDARGRIIKEINRNKNNNPVKYMHGFDMITPYSEFEHLKDGRCVEKDYDNDYQQVYQDTAACPHIETRLSEYDSIHP